MGLKTIRLPDLGEGVTEGEIIKIKVSKGEAILMDQSLVEVMTDKASMEVPSSIEGVIEKVEVAEGDMVSVGASLFTVKTKDHLEEPKAEKKTKDSPPAKKQKAVFTPLAKNAPLAIPSTKRLAKELGINLKDIKGSGSQIKREDLLTHIQSRLKNPSPLSPPLPEDLEEDKREPIRGVKRLMFESMTLSKASIPHFTIGETACIKKLLTVRKEIKALLEKQGLKTGWLAFFIKILIPTLKEFPLFNSLYDPQTKEIVYKKNINIGFAVDSPAGLMVPVLKQAQNKSLLDIIKETQKLAKEARLGQIKREDLTGASLTLSNLGGLGGLYGTPIINPPEMAIMGIYRLFQKTVKNSEGEFEEQAFINFSITCDHRFIDGATAARFLKSFAQKTEEPSLLLLG